jgi:hypothetical protein
VPVVTRDSLPCGERERLADGQRREAAVAARTLASGDHVVGPGARCALCRGPVVVGATVRVVHATTCPRRATLARARTAATAGVAPRRPVTAACRPARTGPSAGWRHVPAQAPAARSLPGHDGLRPSVVLSWQVRGARVRVGISGMWPATVTGLHYDHGTLLVSVTYDDGRWDPEDVPVTVTTGEDGDPYLETDLTPWLGSRKRTRLSRAA